MDTITKMYEEWDCPFCNARCVNECSYNAKTMVVTVTYLDCDCGYVRITNGDYGFERRPNQKGIVWQIHDRANTVRWVTGDESQKIIERRSIEWR